MEKKLRKSALYGFFIGLALMILLIPETRELPTHTGDVKIVPMEPLEYILRILKSAIIITVAVVMSIFIREKRTNDTPALSPIINMLLYLVFGFVIVTAVGTFLVYLIHYVLKLIY
ncbi:hypothetical protein EEL30_02875 [Brevibacillus laterosporus]|uniref:Uncharacterized protein n=1 Tax=Brevibacillus laterosporus TaxID=1465 RepID=A0A518V336_BRELA|nr:hypothetical protein EEL30_02875 [Brevibacillus laterosporus]